ncbi:MAG: Gfo/Idh/MocA family oxidoreductase [Bacteroidetes bacterium]|nr:Gfo/Idh/MocA family oxidoreductase [Bacteroidota bacterium]
MNIAIIGAGLIGGKRAAALAHFPEDTLRVVCDVDLARAQGLAREHGCDAVADWREAVLRDDVDIVVNAAINAVLEPITVAALSAGKHVLCEKPLGRTADEAARMVETAELHHRVLKTGFNHRFHPAMLRARALLQEGAIGDVMVMRARYGHGSRPGMEQEWRSSKDLCGGGELLDQGVHVIDLIRAFGGDLRDAYARVETKFWDIEVEDNAFALLGLRSGATCQFHVSWTNWRNVFSFEIFGTQGYITINGLGGSYGPETLEVGKRRAEGGRPDIEVTEYPAEDTSWREEWKEFRSAIDEQRAPLGSGRDGLMANRVIEALYASSHSGARVALDMEGRIV